MFAGRRKWSGADFATTWTKQKRGAVASSGTVIPRRPEKELVRHVNFEVQRGECLGILGESGSGKSMSIKAMLGLLDKNFSVSGHAWFGEKDLLKENFLSHIKPYVL